MHKRSLSNMHVLYRFPEPDNESWAAKLGYIVGFEKHIVIPNKIRILYLLNSTDGIEEQQREILSTSLIINGKIGEELTVTYISSNTLEFRLVDNMKDIYDETSCNLMHVLTKQWHPSWSCW